MNNNHNYPKPKALITGFSSGIGYAYSNYLSKQGWDLSLISQQESKAKKAYDSINNPHAKYYIADLSKPEEVSRVLKNIESPQLIVANAGVTKYGEAGQLSSAEKRDLFYLLCTGVIDLIEYFLPNMKKTKGSRIVIISSIGAITPMPKSSIYAAAKSGIFSYGQSLHQELLKYNIPVTVSLPGYVKTEAHKRAGLEHLNRKVPSWMWVNAERVVLETENASQAGKSKIIPGIIYKLVKPFLQFNLANRLWNRITRRK